MPLGDPPNPERPDVCRNGAVASLQSSGETAELSRTASGVTEVALPAGELVEFGATGYGLVLNDTKALVEGETATIHLELSKAGTVDIDAPITIEH